MRFFDKIVTYIEAMEEDGTFIFALSVLHLFLLLRLYDLNVEKFNESKLLAHFVRESLSYYNFGIWFVAP